MKIRLLVTGKTAESYLKDGISKYEQRIKRYLPFEIITIPDLKNASSLSRDLQKSKEGENILRNLSGNDYVVLLDENGKELSSVEFAGFIQKGFSRSIQQMVFIVGGPFGVSKEVKERADF